MPIISKGGRKSWRIRLTMFSIYAVLVIGSVTMLYPFLLMLAGSFSNSYDFNDYALVPKYLLHDEPLLKKHLHEKYGSSNFRDFAASYGLPGHYTIWAHIRTDDQFVTREFAEQIRLHQQHPEQLAARAADWQAFNATLPAVERSVFYPDFVTIEDFRHFLREKYLELVRQDDPAAYEAMSKAEREGVAIARLNTTYGRAFNSFVEILQARSFFMQRKWLPYNRPDFDDWLAFKEMLPPTRYEPVPTERMWGQYLQRRFVSEDEFTKQTGLTIRSFTDFAVPVPPGEPLHGVWMDFIAQHYPLRLVTVPQRFEPDWQAYLQELYITPEAYNAKTGDTIRAFSDVRLPLQAPGQDAIRVLWVDFVSTQIPADALVLNMPLTRYQDFLHAKYNDIAALNDAYGDSYATFREIDLPHKAADYHDFITRRDQIRWSFVGRNYGRVVEFVMSKGRAVWVTIVLVVLSIVSALTVNPLAAYALSRGSQAVASKLLIFFLATMAFPAEVAMIPGFLLLRDLGLLNTFAALILPGLANGYSIFLLKGFFDSIPRELYEAAHIDGATELQVFRMVTFPMSKPILAVIALSAFNMAYTGFMWAFLTCQDPQMWTIMVWLYDFQGRYSAFPGMVMAALVLASIPTLLVFLFCQKIIMRGIVIPTMK